MFLQKLHKKQLLLSQSCRSQGYNVGILDILAERLSTDESLQRIKEINEAYEYMLKYKNIEDTEKKQY